MTRKKTSDDATLRDGTKLRYTLHGEEEAGRPRIALAHSLGMNGTVWEDVVACLGDRARVLTYDMRGHGASTKSTAPYRLETFADDLAELLAHVGWPRTHIAGGSLGGSVALQFAVTYPKRVETLGLIDTTAWYGPDGPKNWESRARNAEQKGLAAIVSFQQTRWFSDDFRAQHPEKVEKCTSIFLANEVACFAATGRMLGSFNLTESLGQLRVPTAVVVGEEDYATPLEMSRQLEKGISGATLQIVAKARHLTFVERPNVIAQALLDLMSRAVAAT